MAVVEFSQWQVRNPQGLRKYVNEPEWRHFLAAASELDPSDRAFCNVLAYAGCRVSEALALTGQHVDTEECALTFRTLKRRMMTFRTVPVPAWLLEDLAKLPSTGERIWTMHRATAWRLISGVMGDAGISGPMACGRGLRHGFGIRAARHNVPIGLIQKWMGHASSRTTTIYMDAVGVEEREFAKRMW